MVFVCLVNKWFQRSEKLLKALKTLKTRKINFMVKSKAKNKPTMVGTNERNELQNNRQR
jgi:hypothetical protein